MEENTNSALFTFDSPKGQSSYIKVIGVGGGGGNAVNHMFRQGIEGVDFIVCNTDMKALNSSPVPNKIPLGSLGLGAGGKPEKGRKAAEAKAADITEALSHNTQMLFITAGMGGGTGTGAAPVIAKLAKEIKLESEENENILVVAIVTRPFSFEGSERCQQAEAGIKALSDEVDSIIVINNDKLRSFGNLTKSNAFAMADDILLTAAKGIAEIITKEGTVNRDFQDIKSVMEKSGTALMGTGCGKGENRAHDAIEAATTSVLLDDSDINGAKNVLLYFSYSHEFEMTIDEMTVVTDYVSQVTGGRAKVLWGDSFDDSLGEELKVILIATGFEKGAKSAPEPKHFELPVDVEVPVVENKPVAEIKSDEEGMTLIHKDEAVSEDVISVESVAEQAPDPAKKVVYVLEEEETATIPAPAGNTCPVVDDFKTEIDTMVDEIHIVQPESVTAPVVEPVAQPVTIAVSEPVATVEPRRETGRSAFESDIDVTTAADRIRRIHELLRSNPNGADLVQQMTTSQISSDPIFEGQHSATREASAYTMRADGTMAKNTFLYGNQPD